MRHSIFKSFLRDLETHTNQQEKSDIEQYHIDCWSSCKAIKTSLKKLQIAEECIKSSYRFCPNEHEVAEYIEFHIENYLIRSRSIYDRVLIFTNYLCDIQMAKESVNHISITTNQKVIKANLKEKLKKINRACEVYRVERNGIVHHDKYANDRLEWVDTARKAKYILRNSGNNIGISDDVIAEQTAAIIVNHLAEFNNCSSKINEAVNEFLDSSIDIYDAYAKKHNKKE
ncbi:Cthe_2314 family HEPN domain-containing protein [Vibrio splendidus]